MRQAIGRLLCRLGLHSYEMVGLCCYSNDWICRRCKHHKWENGIC